VRFEVFSLLRALHPREKALDQGDRVGVTSTLQTKNSKVVVRCGPEWFAVSVHGVGSS
jgi:hypothetical protein